MVSKPKSTDINDMTAFAAYARDLQPAAVAMLEREGYRFTNILDDGWQKVAFSLYDPTGRKPTTLVVGAVTLQKV